MSDQSQPKPDDKPFLFRVSNHHSKNCGESPSVDGNRKGHYHGYFENEFGEQAIFVCSVSALDGQKGRIE
ncbi:MAG: hypothetical protein JW892_12380 [Anaerolineae bacterium]|nr:hypothetical protein [Anaerolineae bacterium]